MNIKNPALLLIIFGLLFNVYTFAAEQPRTVGRIRSVRIIEINSIKELERHIDEQAIKSFIDFEVSGVYEGNGDLGTLVGQIESTDGSSDVQMNAELKLYSIDSNPAPLPVGSGASASFSRPTPFKVTIHVAPNGWSPSGNAFFRGPQVGKWWTVVAKAQKYSPVAYEHRYGLTVMLKHSKEAKLWNFYPFGLPKN